MIENAPEYWPSLAEVERQYVDEVLETMGGNRTLAAQILGITRRTLHRKLARWRKHSPVETAASS